MQVFEHYPYFLHFRDKNGDNNWALQLMAQQYLARNRAYQSKQKQSSYLRRRGSGNKDGSSEDEDPGTDEEEEEPEEPPNADDIDSDYALNGADHPAGPARGQNQAPPPTARRTHQHATQTQPARPQTTSAPVDSGPRLPPSPSRRDNRRADKVAAMEEEWEKASTAHAQPKGKTKAGPSTSTKGKQREKSPPPMNESSEEELENTRTYTKKAAKTPARKTVVASSPESTPPPTSKAVKSTKASTKDNTSKVAGPSKVRGKRKVDDEQPTGSEEVNESESEKPATKRPRPRMRAAPPPPNPESPAPDTPFPPASTAPNLQTTQANKEKRGKEPVCNDSQFFGSPGLSPAPIPSQMDLPGAAKAGPSKQVPPKAPRARTTKSTVPIASDRELRTRKSAKA